MKSIKKTLKFLIVIMVVLIVAALAMSYKVIHDAKPALVYSINTQENTISDKAVKVIKKENADCILILGAGIKDRDTPSPILKDRLEAGIALYKAGLAPKLLLTGDNGTNGHNEIHVMLNYCLNKGVSGEDIFCDHAGFSTSESMVRAKNIFDVKKAIIVTQRYHEYRALHIGEAIGLDVVGVSSDQHSFGGQLYREAREILARDKDLLKSILGKYESLGGDKIPISGSGEISHGE